MKYIFHVDMDSFFVSCERKNNPLLINKPVAIAKQYKRSIATAISSELKKLGFKAGDPIYLIKEKFPSVVIVEPNLEYYVEVSQNIFNYIKDNFSDKIEIYSIDECFIEKELEAWQNPLEIATELQEKIKKNTSIPCSIGISYTKFLAKMSTYKAKPHGIIWTKPKDIEKNFYDLEVNKIFGIGKAYSKKLLEAGIKTYQDIVNLENDNFLKKIFGKNYAGLLKQLKGEVSQEIVNTKWNPQGIGRNETFLEDDLEDFSQIKSKLMDLCKDVANSLQSLGREGNVVSIQLRNIDKKWHIFQKKLSEHISTWEKIFDIVLFLFNTNWQDEPLRGIGVRVSNLREIYLQNDFIDLFTDFENDKVKNIILIINNHFKANVLKTLKQYETEIKNLQGIKFIKKLVD
ncbi:Y-family DNA polymerase [Metamycoplasma hyosynoviae]|uniref:Y-family DNA polymerase n=2 Tax=Metamycoplasma hyosynoviae TaxID=29559 RepID=UPI0023581928|nr:DNA polymerase IV [Metamycoplasma hyosynoviae]MDC8915465.1 DNA polymerase IV [Metamycoplasma hyosynoviae]MDC8918214.1 DNA polymerase IV [Metamycoplasma hyosynoviae]MDC8921440.1 DNA polymerase IV [Metamycoplasma hyosynoviae]MDD1359766.1 DNA polymerase IV [Metamycoplasma hyosynoviae]